MKKRIFLFSFFIFTILAIRLEAAEPRRANIYLRVMAVNPSKKVAQTVEVKEYLPREVISADIVVSTGELELKYDPTSSLYYVYGKDVKLAPNETRVLTIELKDVWFIPEEDLDSIEAQSQDLLGQVKGTEYYEAAKVISDKLNERLEEIAISQERAKLGAIKEQIADYRSNRQILGQIKEDVNKIKVFSIAAEGAGGSPGSTMLEKSGLESDVPSRTATWMVIFMIMVFIAVLGGAFFFTWVRSSRSLEKSLSEAKESSFPKSEGGSGTEK